ncbi:MAG: PTS sugar transporter subunit IIA [Candidatus Cloacimonadales bacterium]
MQEVKKISEIIDPRFIIKLKSETKKAALEELIELIGENELITDRKRFGKEIFKREKLMSTGIGLEIAVPHVRHKSIKDFVMALGVKTEGIEYDSIDDKPVKLIFMIGASDTQDKQYIKLLSRLVLRLKNPDFIQKVLAANDSAEIYQIIKNSK